MKSKMILGLIFSIALALYVAAQSEPTQEQGVGPGINPTEGSFVLKKLIPCFSAGLLLSCYVGRRLARCAFRSGCRSIRRGPGRELTHQECR
jgi:hypothetical protein